LKLFSSLGSPLIGEIALPGDKSLSHRAALLSALAEGESQVGNFLVAGVTKKMLKALSALGIDWSLDDAQLTVRGLGLHGFCQPQSVINCGNSATTLRLLAGAIAASGVPAILDGSDGLRRRPMARIVAPLKAMGVKIDGTGNCAPLRLEASHMPLLSIHHRLSVASAQVKSCILLAALSGDGTTILDEPGPSRDHTERMLATMGVTIFGGQVLQQDHSIFRTTLRCDPGQGLNPIRITLPGDISSAAFLIVAALITPGSKISLHGVGLNPTRTGILDALQAMGGRITITSLSESGGEQVGDILVEHSSLRGVEVSGGLVVRMIDEFPVFSVASAFASGRTVVCQAEELRHKESDRISALCQELNHLGVKIEEIPDGFMIHGREVSGGCEVESHGDHRLAMALAVAGLAARSPVVVQGAEIITESFPGFIECLQSLGANLIVQPENM